MSDNELDIDQKVRYALIRNYTEQLPLLLVGYLTIALLIVYSSWNNSSESQTVLVGWYALNVVMVIHVLWITRVYRYDEFKFSPAGWIRILIPDTLALGVLWGLTPVLFMDILDAHSVLTICVLTLGVLSAASYSLSIVPPLFYLFFTPVLMQLILEVYAEGLYIVVATTALFFLFLGWMSHKIFQMIYGVNAARFQSEALAESLREEKEMVERVSQAKTRFLAAASHDLRQPLQAQRMFAEAISARSQNSELNTLGNQIIESQRAMQSMLDALLDISRLDAGTVEPKPIEVKLNDLFHQLVCEFEPMAESKGLVLAVRWPPEHTMVRCDMGLVESILRNLLSNAICYTDTGTVMLAVRRRGSDWRLEVRDSGQGIALEQQQEIFEEFRQLGNPERDSSKGLGLGLSTVQRLCHLLSYPLTLYSRSGHGSVFAFLLPQITGDIVLRQETKVVLELESIPVMDVLVIDDERSVREGLLSALTSYGMNVRCASTREEAIKLVNERRPDVLSVDYRLRDEDTGAAVIMAIREHLGEDIPAVLLTGDTAPERLKQLQGSGCPVLHKPVAIKELLATMQGLL